MENEYRKVLSGVRGSEVHSLVDYGLPNCYNKGNSDLVGKVVEVIEEIDNNDGQDIAYLCVDSRGKYLITYNKHSEPSTKDNYINLRLKDNYKIY